MLLKRYLACQTFSKCQPYSNDSFLSIHTVAQLEISKGVGKNYEMLVLNGYTRQG